MTRTNFLLGLFTTFKVIETVIFKKMCFKKITKKGGDSWFDTFMQKTLHFLVLRQTTIRIKSLNLLIFDLLKGHIICIYLNKP